MAEAPDTLEGWYVLHEFLRVDHAALDSMPPQDRAAIRADTTHMVCSLGEADGPETGSTAAFRILGHKGDALLICLRPTIEELADAEAVIAGSGIARVAAVDYSYLSVTELSLYEASARGGTDDPEKLRQMPHVRNRLYPAIPDMPYVSFYPMNKRRGETVNWYAADINERRRMMREHGATGRKYRGRVTQIITGSVGMDDWEWGVTLFASDPVSIKRLVYEMRFDEVSARYADFGLFRFGVRVTPEGFGAVIAGDPPSLAR